MDNNNRSLRDTQTEVSNRHTLFTDGSKYANVLVRELYIRPEDLALIAGDSDPRMALVYARKEPSFSYHSIILAEVSSYSSQAGNYINRFEAIDWDTNIITFTGKGAFANKFCYMVADWETVWELATAAGYVQSGHLQFLSYLNEPVVTNLKFSPVIASNIEPELGEVTLPAYTLQRQSFVLPAATYEEISVSTFTALKAAIDTSSLTRKTHVIINLTADILMTTKIQVPANTNVVINGNGHRIFEYHNETASLAMVNGRRCADYSGTVEANTAFNTPDGKMLLLSKSAVYQSNGWGSNYATGNMQFSANGLSADTDNTFVSFGVWYERRDSKVTSWNNNKIYFSVPRTSDDVYVSGISIYTPKPYYFLINYGDDKESILIKNSKLYYPAKYHAIAKCTLDYLFTVDAGAMVEMHDVYLSGAKKFVIENNGSLKLTCCTVTNPIGGGITSKGNVFIHKCRFTDIQGYGILSKNSAETSIPYVDVTYSVFNRIGLYGTNIYGVKSDGKGYIAHNDFTDTNYGALRVGIFKTSSSFRKCGCINVVEYNRIRYTPEWSRLLKKLGLQDSGAIYVATNNNQAVIRYNTVVGTCGPDLDKAMNRGIFCDGGAYNVTIYCNVVAYTENSYDIELYDYNGSDITIPEGETHNNNNTVCYNVCTGSIKVQEHDSSTSGGTPGTTCVFEKNVILRAMGNLEKEEKSVVNSSYHPYTNGTPIVFDRTGYVDADGDLFSAFNYYSVLGIECFIL